MHRDEDIFGAGPILKKYFVLNKISQAHFVIGIFFWRGVKHGATRHRAKRYVCTFKAVKAGLVHTQT